MASISWEMFPKPDIKGAIDPCHIYQSRGQSIIMKQVFDVACVRRVEDKVEVSSHQCLGEARAAFLRPVYAH